jgi:hypothetical protein
MAPVTVAVTLLGIWMSQKGDRQRRLETDRRMHSAMFGYQEGATKVPGIYDIVVADGNGGNLSAIAQGARTAANNAVLTTSETKKLVAAHVIRDDERWEEVSTSLGTLAQGQADATSVLNEHRTNIASTLGDLTSQVTEHIEDDRRIWTEMGAAIESLATGQTAAAKKAEGVAKALSAKTAPVKKAPVVKKAAKKRA